MTPTYSVNDSSLIATIGRLSKIVKKTLTFSFLFQKRTTGLWRETSVLTTASEGPEELSKTASSGKVWLVGFGPGDPELLTIKGYNLIKTADIIFYDDLLNKEFLLTFRAEKVYVGKRKGNHSIEQAAINKLLYEAASRGKTVVRLKGGDPMIFAHGGEEIEYLRHRHIEVGVVPGITAALAAAALTQIPLTYRGIASSVSFITGHANREIQVPKSGTLVYYMGASNLQTIAKEVINKGWPENTPVLLVYNVSGSDQETHDTTLKQILSKPVQYQTPLIIVIGKVVGLKRNYLFHNHSPWCETENLAEMAYR